MRSIRLAVITLLASALLSACGGGGGGGSVPANPTNVTATPVSSTSVRVSWSAVPAATGYVVERRTGAGNYSQIATTEGGNVTEHTDTGLTPATQYTYRVKARNARGSGEGSESQAVTTPADNGSGTAIESIQVASDRSTLIVGQNATITATARDAGGDTVPDQTFDFTVTGGIGSVSPDSAAGETTFTASAVGSGQVCASSGGKQGCVSLTVMEPPTSITINPSTVEQPVGETQQFTATARDSGGNDLGYPQEAFTWNSSDPSIASVSSSGLATAHRRGTVSISASIGNTTGTAQFNVTEVTADILLVLDQDYQDEADRALYSNALTAAGANFDQLITSSDANTPTLAQIQDYSTVIYVRQWNPASTQVIAALGQYLDLPDRKLLFFSGSGIQPCNPCTGRLFSAAGITVVTSRLLDSEGDLVGQEGSLAAGLTLTYARDEGQGRWSNTLTVNTEAGAQPIFVTTFANQSEATVMGVQRSGVGVEGNSKVAVIGVTLPNFTPNAQANLMQRFLEF